MAYLKIKHDEHEIEVEGSNEFIESQIEKFYISISYYNQMKGGEKNEKTYKKEKNE